MSSTATRRRPSEPALPRAREPRLPWAWLAVRPLLRLAGGFAALAVIGIAMAFALTAMNPEWAGQAAEDDMGISPRAATLEGGGLDAEVTAAVNEAVPPERVPVAVAVGMLAKIWVVVPVIALIGGAVWWRSRRTTAFWVPLVATMGGLALSITVKFAVFRPRPPESVAMVDALGPSFPSGHAIRAVALFGAYAWLLWAAARSRAARTGVWALASVLALAVGFARVVEGAHWLSDILASYLLGAGWLAVVLWASGLLGRREATRETA